MREKNDYRFAIVHSLNKLSISERSCIIGQTYDAAAAAAATFVPQQHHHYLGFLVVFVANKPQHAISHFIYTPPACFLIDIVFSASYFCMLSVLVFCAPDFNRFLFYFVLFLIFAK